jgi:hypothetical protein
MPDAVDRIFLSYRREDRNIAGRLADRLVHRRGRERVFFDVETLEPGADFVQEIIEAVMGCAVLIAVIGPRWQALTDRVGRRKLDDPDDLVVLEIKTALERGIRVIPLLVDAAVMPTQDDLPASLHDLARRHAVVVEHNTFNSDVKRMIAAIENVVSQASRRDEPIEDKQRPPGRIPRRHAERPALQSAGRVRPACDSHRAPPDRPPCPHERWAVAQPPVPLRIRAQVQAVPRRSPSRPRFG